MPARLSGNHAPMLFGVWCASDHLLGQTYHLPLPQNWQADSGRADRRQNGDVTIGLFEGMFEKNMLTSNPGWNDQAENLESFKDIRVIQ